jgi:AcrR family transcriptional regulator
MEKRTQPTEQARAWLDPAVDFVLAHGLAGLTLRPLAMALGTSDRMVNYHFGSKEQLVARIVERASERLAALMTKRLTPAPNTAYEVLGRFWTSLIDAETAPYVRLYFELWIAASREPALYAEAVERITSGWLVLVENMLAETGDRLQPGVAVDALGFDGLIIVRSALGSGSADAAAERLARRLTRAPDNRPRPTAKKVL